MKRILVPLPLRADAYTISGEVIAGEEAREKSVYTLVDRYSPKQNLGIVAQDSRMVFYGISDFIRNHLSQPITHKDIDDAKEFMQTAYSFGGPLFFPEELWRRVVNEYNGYLPILIQGLPEGSTYFPNEPKIQVTSLGKGFGEIAAHIEALMLGMTSIASVRATVTRHWLDRIREVFIRYSNLRETSIDELSQEKLKEIDAFARFMIHDFGMRAHSCAEESEMLGRAHLLVFHGTDTFNAAYQARKLGASPPTGTSILALAHRIVQGHISEESAYNRICEAANGGWASYVADCYDFKNAVQKFLVKLAQEKKGTIVVRPDSGDDIEDVLYIAYKAYEAGLYAESNGYKESTNLRFIQGNSMNPEKIDKIFKALAIHNFNPVKWGIFGVGGWLRNICTRDTFSSSYKLSAKGANNTPVVKLSETRGKLSVPGPVSLYKKKVGPSVYHMDEIVGSELRYICWYTPESMQSGRLPAFEPFSKLQDRTINEFDWFRDANVERGVIATQNVLSKKLQAIQENTIQIYNKGW